MNVLYFFHVNAVKYTDKTLTLGLVAWGIQFFFILLYGDLKFWIIKRVDKGQITREKELER